MCSLILFCLFTGTAIQADSLEVINNFGDFEPLAISSKGLIVLRESWKNDYNFDLHSRDSATAFKLKSVNAAGNKLSDRVFSGTGDSLVGLEGDTALFYKGWHSKDSVEFGYDEIVLAKLQNDGTVIKAKLSYELDVIDNISKSYVILASALSQNSLASFVLQTDIYDSNSDTTIRNYKLITFNLSGEVLEEIDLNEALNLGNSNLNYIRFISNFDQKNRILLAIDINSTADSTNSTAKKTLIYCIGKGFKNSGVRFDGASRFILKNNHYSYIKGYNIITRKVSNSRKILRAKLDTNERNRLANIFSPVKYYDSHALQDESKNGLFDVIESERGYKLILKNDIDCALPNNSGYDFYNSVWKADNYAIFYVQNRNYVVPQNHGTYYEYERRTVLVKLNKSVSSIPNLYCPIMNVLKWESVTDCYDPPDCNSYKDKIKFQMLTPAGRPLRSVCKLEGDDPDLFTLFNTDSNGISVIYPVLKWGFYEAHLSCPTDDEKYREKILILHYGL